jgi:predicted transcriptional regulator
LKDEMEKNSRKRRDRLYIIAEILSIARDTSLKTQIMYKANLSFAQLNEYLNFLLKMELLQRNTEEGKTTYKTTAKGMEYLQNYEEISNLLRKEKGNPINSQIFWLKRKT